MVYDTKTTVTVSASALPADLARGARGERLRRPAAAPLLEEAAGGWRANQRAAGYLMLVLHGGLSHT